MTKTLNERITKYCQVTLETMAYAGTGDVLKVQEMLSILGEHIEVEDGEAWKVRPVENCTVSALGPCYCCYCIAEWPFVKSRLSTVITNALRLRMDQKRHCTVPQVAHQSPAVFGLALVAMGEELGSAMSLRTLEHLLQYSEPSVRYTDPCSKTCHS